MDIKYGDIVFVRRPCGWFVFLKTFIPAGNRPAWWRPLAGNKRAYAGPPWPHTVDDYDFNRNAVEIITHVNLSKNGDTDISPLADKIIRGFLDARSNIKGPIDYWYVPKKSKLRYNWATAELEEINRSK